MTKDFDRIRAEARDYGMECKQADRKVIMGDFSERLGMGRQWLSSGHSLAADEARAVVLEEWARLGVKAHNTLSSALTKAAGTVPPDREWTIPDNAWPDYEELTRILAQGGRRNMFEDLRNRYGREVAMRYAYVCDHPAAKGARREWAGHEAEIAADLQNEEAV
jgi:hypothetical protein